MADPDPYQTPIPYDQIGEQIATGMLRLISASGIQKTIVSSLTESKGAVWATILKLIGEIPVLFGKALAGLEETGAPFVAEIAAPTIDALFGTSIGPGAFTGKMNADSACAAGEQIAGAIVKAFSPTAAGALSPGPEGAQRVAGAAIGATLGGTFNALIVEILTQWIPEDLFHVDSLARLPEDVLHSMGLGRLVRQVLAPLVKVGAADPMLWHVNKLYAPTLLPAETAVRAIIAATDDDSAFREDLARLGYSEDRITTMMQYASKFRSVADAYFMVQIGQWDEGIATQHLRDAGYDVLGAQDELDLQKFRRIDTYERGLATAAIAAYARGAIDDGALDTYARGSTFDALETAQVKEAAAAHRIFATRQLSATQAEQCVLAGVLAVEDYTAALARENYAPDAVDALELLIRVKVDAQTARDKTTAAAAAAKADQAAAKQAAAAAKADATAKAAALKQLGPLGALATAFIQGLIPIERYNEVAAAHYDADTVAILDAELQTKAAAYAATHAAAGAATTAAAAKGLSIGALNAAVLAGVLTVDQFRSRLVTNGLPSDSVDVLTATIAAKLANTQAAQAIRAQAQQRAANRGVSLTQAESLVRGGHWTMAQYNAVLAALNYDAGSIASLDELLQDKIDKDAAASTIRAAPSPSGAAKGLTASQFLQAVVLQAKTIDQYETFLTNAGYSADAVSTLIAEATDKLDAANVARSNRQAAGTGAVDATLAPLADVTRAARLGLITQDAYNARFQAAGYSAADIAMEDDLLVQEIAASRAASTAAAGTPTTATQTLSLAQLATLVKDGQATLDQYTARAIALGYGADDVTMLTNLLADQAAAAQAAKARHAVILARTATKHPSLADMEKAVVNSIQTMDDYNAYLTAAGYGDADVQILDALLQLKIDAAAAKAGG
ncbi:MAG: hypothetical protein ACRD1V_17880 [Vicinamibacterales bacterium]